MREKIIQASIESLRQEGLRFSVDTLAEKLKISKKTVYKYFPDKQALALALYETYYGEAVRQAQALAARQPIPYVSLLRLYFDAKMMTQNRIFNKYQLNEALSAYTTAQNHTLWAAICASWPARDQTPELRLIIDGTMEKLCVEDGNADAVLERLVELL